MLDASDLILETLGQILGFQEVKEKLLNIDVGNNSPFCQDLLAILQDHCFGLTTFNLDSLYRA